MNAGSPSQTLASINADYENDGKYKEERKDAHSDRGERRPILKQILSNFLEGKVGLKQFHEEVTKESFAHNAWRFTGTQGLMFFNQLVNAPGQNDTADILRHCLTLPKSTTEAKEKVAAFAEYIMSIRQRAARKLNAPQVGRSLFFLTFFWEKQDANSPIYRPSAAAGLQSLGFYAPSGAVADNYEQYLRAFERLRLQLNVSAEVAEDILYHVDWKGEGVKDEATTSEMASRPQESPTERSNYDIQDFVSETGIAQEIAKSWLRRLKRKMHVVFQGSPGTGKTFVAERLAKLLASSTNGTVDLVQFHPAYTYEDFIQGLRPVPAQNGYSFKLEPGRFLEFCRKAEPLSPSPCILIIDELNRGNPPRIFGELMYLLEYRDKSIPLAAGGEPFRIPKNVYLIGTMNTADRSIALVDHAFRRRFSFVRLKPDLDVLRSSLLKKGLPAESLVNVIRKVNATIDDQDYEVGISFFMKEGDRLKENIQDIWESEIEPYLEEYFYDQPGKVEPFRWATVSKNELREWAT